MSRYGPHDPNTLPAHGRRFGPSYRAGKRADLELIPFSALLARQRATLNALAHGTDTTPMREGLCRICSRPEAACLAVRPGDDPHEYEPPR